MTLETGNRSHNCDYIYNNLNQQEEYGKNKKLTVAGEYTFDETNKMVRGINGNGEESIYTYNGLGALMEQTWIIAKNGYGYHGVDAVETPEPDVPDLDEPTKPVEPEDPDVPDPGVNNEGNGNNNGNNRNGHGNGNNGNHGKGNKNQGNNGNHYGNQEETPEEETTTASANGLTAALVTYGNAGNGNNGNNGNGNGNQDKPTGSNVKKTSTVVKQFVVDFSRETYKPLMEHEVNGLDYRYVYSDKARLSVVVQGIDHGSASLLDSRNELHAYYHCDYLGTTDYLTSAVNSKIISWTSYSEWGEISHNAVLKCGQRELDLVKEYATHDFDAVLNMYYAKARFYDADNRRFTAVDPILDPSRYDLREYVTDPMQLVQTLYVKDNAVNWIDLMGLTSVEDADQLIKDNAISIIAAATSHDVDPAIIAGVIYVEQTWNYNWVDRVTDVPLFFIDTSIGIGQVKVSTAKLLEDKGYISKTYFVRFMCVVAAGHFPKEVKVWYAPGYGEVIGSRERAIAQRLTVNLQNIYYVAAYLSYMQDAWINTYDISNRPDILGTLFNLGERTPNTSPKANDFGNEVEKQHAHMLELLGLAVSV